jgi:hypothetical protein
VTTQRKTSSDRKLVSTLALAAAFASFVSFARPCCAQDQAARAAAVELFDAADRLVADGKISEACPKYAESYRMDPQLGAILHLADCYEKDGKLASAYAAFREAGELAQQKGDERQTLAEERSAALEPRLSRISVDVPEANRLSNLEISRDGLLLAGGSWNTPIPVDAGEHKIVAKAPGYRPWEGVVSVVGEGTQHVEIPVLEALPTEPVAPIPVAPPPVQEPPPKQSDAELESRDTGATARTVGFVLGGAGIVGLGVGGVFLLQKGSKLDERDGICPTGICPAGTGAESQKRINALTDDARSAATLSTISFVGGGVLLATGIVLVITAPKTELAPQESAFQLAPVVDGEHFGVFAYGAF